MFASSGENIKFWNGNSYTESKRVDVHQNLLIPFFTLSQDRSLMVSCDIKRTKLCLVSLLSNSRKFFAQEDQCSCIVFNSNAHYILAGSKSGKLYAYDTKSLSKKKLYKGHSQTVSSIAISQKDVEIASGNSIGEIIIHSFNPGEVNCRLIHKELDSSVRQVRFSPSNSQSSLLGSVYESGMVALWDTSRKVLLRLFRDTHDGPAYDLAFSPYNHILFITVGLDKRLVSYDSVSQKVIHTMITDEPLTSIEFLSSGGFIAVGTAGGHIQLYDLNRSKEPVHQIRAHSTSVYCIKYLGELPNNAHFLQNVSVCADVPENNSNASNMSCNITDESFLMVQNSYKEDHGSVNLQASTSTKSTCINSASTKSTCTNSASTKSTCINSASTNSTAPVSIVTSSPRKSHSQARLMKVSQLSAVELVDSKLDMNEWPSSVMNSLDMPDGDSRVSEHFNVPQVDIIRKIIKEEISVVLEKLDSLEDSAEFQQQGIFHNNMTVIKKNLETQILIESMSQQFSLQHELLKELKEEIRILKSKFVL